MPILPADRLDAAEERNSVAGLDLDRPHASTLDEGNPPIDVAHGPSRNGCRLRRVCGRGGGRSSRGRRQRHRPGRFLGGRKVHAPLQALDGVDCLGEFRRAFGLRALDAVEALGNLAELRTCTAGSSFDSGAQRGELGADLFDRGLHGADILRRSRR